MSKKNKSNNRNTKTVGTGTSLADLIEKEEVQVDETPELDTAVETVQETAEVPVDAEAPAGEQAIDEQATETSAVIVETPDVESADTLDNIPAIVQEDKLDDKQEKRPIIMLNRKTYELLKRSRGLVVNGSEGE